MHRAIGVMCIAVIVLGAACAAQSPTPKAPQDTLGQLISDLKSDNWPRVWRAKLLLESRQREAIPALLELLSSTQRVKLRNTADLIYPGAEEFYGHGFIVNYDLDMIGVRAGWVLEETTFEEFGFRGGAVEHDALMQATITGKSSEYVKRAQVLTRDPAADAVANAKKWWSARAADWSRYKALLDALQSGDPSRQTRASDWLRNGETACDGLNEASLHADIYPIADKLLASKNESVRTEGKYLKEARPEWILKNKTEYLKMAERLK